MMRKRLRKGSKSISIKEQERGREKKGKSMNEGRRMLCNIRTVIKKEKLNRQVNKEIST